MDTWTILRLLEWTAEFFKKHEIPNPRLDAELLLSHVLGKKRIDLYLAFDETVGAGDLTRFKELIQRRQKREPLQYITGVQEFFGVPIKVTPDVLIPRPETEILVEETLKCLSQRTNVPTYQRTILDLCTGSGCIIAALANELPDATFTGIDISEKAIAIAKENTQKWSNRVEFLQGDLFSPLLTHQRTNAPTYDVITCNPPYIPSPDFATLQEEVRDYEPKEALVSGDDGLDIVRVIITEAHHHLKPHAPLVMEIGINQASAVKEFIESAGKYDTPIFIKDFSGIDRIVIANKL